MKLQKLTLRIVAALFAFSAVACVDKDFRLDETSSEVTLGQGKTIIPLGYLEEMSIGSMLNNGVEIEGLYIDPVTGEYSLRFAGDEASFEVEGVTNSLEIPSMTSTFGVEYPQFDLSSEAVKVSSTKQMKLNLGELEKYTKYGLDIPVFIENAITGHLNETITPEHLHFQVPEQIHNIVAVFFKDIESGREGAPLHLKLDLNDIKTINGGGELLIDLRLDGGQFVMSDDEGINYDDNHFVKRYDIKPGDENVEFVLYVDRIINDKSLDDNHELDIPLSLTYDLSFSMDVQPGKLSLDSLPMFNVDADFEYGDADVLLNKEVKLVEYHPTEANDVTIDNLPAEIESIKSIELKDDSHISLFARGLDWFGDAAELIEVDITLPAYLNLHSLDGVNYEYVESGHLLKATLADLEEGLEIGLTSIEFEGDGLRPENGVVHMNFAPDIEVHFAKDAEIMVSALMPEDNNDIVISTGLNAVELDVKSVSGRIAYGYEHSEVIYLGDLSSGMNLEIEGEGLSPVICINLRNPLSLDAFISAKLTPMSGGVAHPENAVSFENIAIKPAQYVNGNIIPGEMHLVLADESHREEYSSEEYIFVACSVGKLLSGSLPEAFEMSLSVNTNDECVSTLYVEDEFTLSYDYSVNVPLSFNKELAIGYSGTVGGLREIFSQLAIDAVRVSDFALLINFKNSAPLDFALDAELLDVDGVPTPINVNFPEGSNVIAGSEDGVSAAESNMRLELRVPNGNLAGIDQIESIRFDFKARGASHERVALKESQGLSARLQLELNGGVTIDLNPEK